MYGESTGSDGVYGTSTSGYGVFASSGSSNNGECVPADQRYFRPEAEATRGQIAKIASNAAGYIEPPVGQTFEDVPPDSTFYDFVQRLTSRGVMFGYPCGSPGELCNPPLNRPYFRPANNATRGQTSKIIAYTFFPDCSVPH